MDLLRSLDEKVSPGGAAGTYKITPNGEIDTTVFIGTWGADGKVQVIRAWTPPKID